jgi:hypothetical protein
VGSDILAFCSNLSGTCVSVCDITRGMTRLNGGGKKTQAELWRTSRVRRGLRRIDVTGEMTWH